MPDPTRKPIGDEESGTESSLLSEIRTNFDHDTDAFADIRKEGSIDIQYIANDPWPDKEKQQRKEQNRPLIACDLLNQYTNLVINEIRQHPREIKISPAGYGATAKLAEFRENRVRAIQYKSNAQSAYVTAMENATQRGYGAARIGLRYVSETSFDQEIVIKRMPNPDAILWDSGCKELDCSDAEHCFVLDQISIKQFRREYPKAQIVDFSGDLAHEYPQWIKDKFIQIAEYWRVEKQSDELIQFQSSDGKTISQLKSKLDKLGFDIEQSKVFFPEIPGQQRLSTDLIDQRKTRIPSVMQYITNGVEILEENKWLGKWIPIVPIFGKELYITEAGGSKRMLLSLIRNARDAQMAYNYFKTCETEAVGRVPKALYMAYEGQFEGHEEEVAEANQVPKGFLYAKARVGGGQELLPLPQFQPFDPPVQNLEIGAESFSRSIQSAVGMYNSSVGKNDTNVKSGRAIKELDEQSDLGAFHFIANYNQFITRCGEIVNDLVSKVEISEREVPIRKQDGTEALVRINTQEPYLDDKTGEMQHYPMDLGEFDVTIGVGPNADSQREEASDFIETFIQELPNMQIEPGKKEALLALAIKIKQMGPIADQMVDILQPQEGDPQQLQASLQQMQGQLQQLQQENQALHMDRAARVLEQQTKIQIEGMRGQHQMDSKTIDFITQIVKAELAAKSKSDDATAQADATKELSMLGFSHDATLQHSAQAHEVASGAIEHQRAMELAQQQAAQAQASQAADQGHDIAMTAAGQAHEQGMASQGQVHEQTMAEKSAKNKPAKP